MLDIGWPELFVICAVALVAIGPKDLPKVMRSLGGLVRKSRLFFQEISAKLDQLAFEAEMAEKIKKEHEQAEKKEKNNEVEVKHEDT